MVKEKKVKYDLEEVQEIKFRNGHRRLQVRAERADGKFMTVYAIEDLMSKVAAEYGCDITDITVSGMNRERQTTLKGYADEEFADWYIEEYLQNKSEDIREKLAQFAWCYFLINL